MVRLLLSLAVAMTALCVVLPDAPKAASDQQMICMQQCLDKHGANKQTACAIECGLTSGPVLGAPQRDCGIEYRECMKACGKDKACKEQCRTARQSCI